MKAFKEKGLFETTVVLCHGPPRHGKDALRKYLSKEDDELDGCYGMHSWGQKTGTFRTAHVIWVNDPGDLGTVLHELSHLVDTLCLKFIPEAKVDDTRETRAQIIDYWGPKVLEYYKKEAEKCQS